MTSSDFDPRDDQAWALLLDLARAGIARQYDAWDAVDRKGSQVFAAAAVVIGLASLGDRDETIQTVLLLASLIAFGVVALAALSLAWSRSLRVLENADELWSWGFRLPTQDLQHGLLADAEAVYASNGALLRRKHLTFRLLTAATGVEVVLVVAAIVSG